MGNVIAQSLRLILEDLGWDVDYVDTDTLEVYVDNYKAVINVETETIS